MMQRIRVINGAVEESVSVFADGVERKRGRTEDTSGTVLSEVSPTGGSRSQVDSRGRLVSLTEVSTSLSDGEQRTYDYSGNDPRPIAVTDYWTAISLQYASDSLNLETISSSSSLWGGTEHYGHSPRDEYLSYFSKGSTSIASVFAGAHLSSLSQGAGSIGLTYGIGGLTIAAYSGVYLEYRTHSFSTSSSSYRCLYGSNGGIRLFSTPYDRPYEAYRVSSSGSETKIASWTYGFSDSDTESAASPIRSYHDLVLGTVDVQELAPAERKATVTRTDGAGARGGVFTRVWDERGRTSSLVFALSGRNLTLTHSFTYPAGTTAPSSMTGTITDNSLTCYYGNSVTYDAFGRVSTVPSSFDGVGVERRLTYFHGIPSSVKTTCTYGGSSVIATESLSIDGAKRIKQVVLSDAGNTFTSSFKRDDEGRIIREDNPFFGYTYVYSYSPSGCIKEVKRGTYSDADSPSVFPWRSFEYSATWGPLLTSVDGVAVTNASGYPTLIQGNALSWEAGRLLGYGSSTFGYDAQGNCVSRSGGGGSSTFVYDPSGRLLEEVCSSYSIAFIYGLSGLIGFRVRSGSAAGNYTYRYDALGNVAAIVGPSGVAARYAYDAFGNGKVCDANWQENASDQFVGNINPIRYKGGLFDRGTGLYRFGSRWYAPFLYRWLSPDGAEYLDGSRVDGANPYAYCYNDPVTYVDADGHFPILAGILLGLGVLTLTGAGLLIGGRVSGNDILVNAGDSILSGVEMAAGVALIVFCPSSLIGVGILGVGIGSFTNGLINMSNGGSYHAGWAGGQLAGGLSFIPYFGGPIGAFFGSAFTDLIDGEYDITAIDWWKAGFTGAISFGLSWLNITVNWGASSGLYSLGRAANLVSAYDYALLSISGGILNAWWRGKRKPI